MNVFNLPGEINTELKAPVKLLNEGINDFTELYEDSNGELNLDHSNDGVYCQ